VPIAAAPAARAAFFATRLAFGRNVFALVVLLDFGLVRPRFGFGFGALHSFFHKYLPGCGPITAQTPRYSKARRISIRNKREAMLIRYKGAKRTETVSVLTFFRQGE
jgi:hypothetical protein